MITDVAVRDGGLVRPGRPAPDGRPLGCHAEVSSDLLDEQGQLLDSLIGLAFDVLGARHLALRIVPGDRAQPRAPG